MKGNFKKDNSIIGEFNISTILSNYKTAMIFQIVKISWNMLNNMRVAFFKECKINFIIVGNMEMGNWY